MRRRNRFPRRLIAVSLATLLLVLTASLLTLPAFAKNGMRMPRTEDGVVTDGDGIIGSGDGMTNPIPEIGDAVSEGIDDLLPNASTDGTAGGTTPITEAPGAGTSSVSATESGGSADDGGAFGGNAVAWIIGLTVLAGVVIAIVLIVRYASSKRDE